MLITLELGSGRRQVAKMMRELATDALNLANGQSGAYKLHQEYLSWVNTARSRLRGHISDADVKRLVFSERYGVLLSLQIPTGYGSTPLLEIAAGEPLREMLRLEFKQHIEHLQAASHVLDYWGGKFDAPDRGGQFVVADANVFCHHPDRLPDWDVGADSRASFGEDVHLILPMQVLDELDKLKDRGQGEARTNARKTIKYLAGLLPSGVVRERGAMIKNGMPCGAITLDLWPDPPGHVRLPRPDDEIVARTAAFNALVCLETTVLTADAGMWSRSEMEDGLVPVLLDLPDAARRAPKPPRGTRHPARAAVPAAEEPAGT